MTAWGPRVSCSSLLLLEFGTGSTLPNPELHGIFSLVKHAEASYNKPVTVSSSLFDLRHQV
jgi:hypothetical protein